MVNVLRAIILAVVLGVRVVVLVGVGVALGVLVAPVVVHAALGHLPAPSALVDMPATSSAGGSAGLSQDPSVRAALSWTPADTARLDQTLDNPLAVLDGLGAALARPVSP